MARVSYYIAILVAILVAFLSRSATKLFHYNIFFGFLSFHLLSPGKGLTSRTRVCENEVMIYIRQEVLNYETITTSNCTGCDWSFSDRIHGHGSRHTGRSCTCGDTTSK